MYAQDERAKCSSDTLYSLNHSTLGETFGEYANFVAEYRQTVLRVASEPSILIRGK